MSSCLESLSTEILYEVFDNLSVYEVFCAFTGLTRQFNIALAQYPVRLDMRFVSRYALDYLCCTVRPEQILSLTLSDSVRSCGQMEIFLKSVQIEQMKNLRSLTLLEGEHAILSSILTRLPCANQLKSMVILDGQIKYGTQILAFFGLPSTFDYTHPLLNFINTPLHHLCHLAINVGANDSIQQMFSLVPRLQSLFIDIGYTMPELNQLPTNLSKLTLVNSNGKLSFNNLTQHLACLTQLKYLNLELMNVSQKVTDGNRWENFLMKYLPNLVNFQFKFQIHTSSDSIDDIIESFRSAFWLEDKRWFVVLNKAVPYSFHESVNILSTIPLYTPKKWLYIHPFKPMLTTAPSSFDFGYYIKHLILNFEVLDCNDNQSLKGEWNYTADNITTDKKMNFSMEDNRLRSYNLVNVQTLELHGGNYRHTVTEYEKISKIQTLLTLRSIQRLDLGHAIVSMNVLYALLNIVPSVTHLTVSHIVKLEKLTMDNHSFNQIKTLTITSWNGGQNFQCGNGFLSNSMLCRHFELFYQLFAYVEHIDMPVDRAHDLVSTINGLQHLKSGTFRFSSLSSSFIWSDECAMKQSFEDEIMRKTRLSSNDFTCRIRNTTCHLWIKVDEAFGN
ncbi:hypothetical protein I4U23_027200 [Adineta vaga]|nr:hypothetical protein I4U23_027200 [Adineta vaga]